MRITDDILYVGVNDHNIDLFEGQYIVPNGMAYNSYVINDEKIAVMDTVDAAFGDEWLKNIADVLNGATPDYLIIQHMEPDHSANIQKFLEVYPNIKVVGNAKTFTMIGNFFRDLKLADENKLEVKNKDNKGRTDKRRIRVGNIHSLYTDGAEGFLEKHAWYHLSELKPWLENNFYRITLVNKAMTERLTIDTDICFCNLQTGKEAALNRMVIIELKRDGRTFSPIREVLRNLHIQPSGISKYCMGTVLTSPTVKHNRFKQKIRVVGRIQEIVF